MGHNNRRFGVVRYERKMMEAFEYNLTKFAEQIASLTGCSIDEGRSLLLQGMLFYDVEIEDVIAKLKI